MSWVVVAQHLGGRGRRIAEFKGSLVYRTTEKDPVSLTDQKKRKGLCILVKLHFWQASAFRYTYG